MMMRNSTALDSPLVDELLALLAVLRDTMHCLHNLDLNCQLPQGEPISPEQLFHPLQQQMTQLHSVGLKLSVHWEGFQDEDNCKTDFVQSLAWEVRNFVSIVLNTMGTFERYGDRLSPARRLALLASTQKAIENLTSLLEEAETLSGASGMRTEERVALNIEKLCETIIRERKVDSPERLIRLIRKGKSRLERIDEAWLRQSLNKVLDNAIAYSPRNSIVILKLLWAADELRIQIQDLGIGIPAAEQSKIFKPFYRANNTQAVSGRGLGLAIAQQAMALQGGSIAVLSTLGQGTTVTLYFPNMQAMKDRAEPEYSNNKLSLLSSKLER